MWRHRDKAATYQPRRETSPADTRSLDFAATTVTDTFLLFKVRMCGTLIPLGRNGIFPAVSVNKRMTVVSTCSPTDGEPVSPEGAQEG